MGELPVCNDFAAASRSAFAAFSRYLHEDQTTSTRGSAKPDSQRMEEECVDIYCLLDPFGEGGASSMTRVGTGPKQNRFLRRAGFLQTGRHLAGLHRIDAWIIGAGQKQDGRIADPLLHAMIG